MKLTSKRRRTKQEIKEEKTREELKQREIAEKMAAFEQLQAKYQKKEQELAELQNATKDIGKMFDQGLLKVDEDGQYKVVEDQEEREFLNQSNKKNQGNMMADDFEDAQN